MINTSYQNITNNSTIIYVTMFNFHCSLDHYAKTGVQVFYLYWFVTIVLRKPISACTSMPNITIQHGHILCLSQDSTSIHIDIWFCHIWFFFRVWGL